MAPKKQVAVDWAKVDALMPTGATPACQAARKKLFDGMDPNRGGTLTLTECEGGLPEIVNDIVPNRNYRPAVKAAFAVARNAHAEGGKKNSKAAKEAGVTVDREEFHALLIAFRQFLELDVLFDSIDKDGTRMLSWKEAEKACDALKDWNICKKQVRAKFKDDWTESLKYEDFADFCVNSKLGRDYWSTVKWDANDAMETLQEAVKTGKGGSEAGQLLEAFKNWDADGGGFITEDELFQVLKLLDDTFTQDNATALFKAADANSDGMIDYAEFSAWVSQ